MVRELHAGLGARTTLMSSFEFAARNVRVIKALMLRETVTRFGREGLGFLWLIGEPLMFCIGVLVMWSLLKPEYEHGVRLGPFVMTGYMCLLLLRHQSAYSLGALQGNIGLLYHRQINVLSVYITRNLLEFLGSTAAFVVVYAVLIIMGQVTPPKDWGLLLGGWMIMCWISTGFALSLAALSLRSEVMERLVPLIQYTLIPISGAFFMVEWIPNKYREPYLLLPFPHGIEMVRAGVFGEFVPTHFNAWYAIMVGGVLNFAALILLADARSRVDIE
jgi:capsular polysaccharide transport system permease protein